jgi:hypothetical protein
MSCNNAKEHPSVRAFRAVSQSVSGMMATSRSRDFFPYFKAILGAGVLIGILFLIGQLGASFRN